MTDRVPAFKVLLLDVSSVVEARKLAPHRYMTETMREAEPAR